MGFYEHSLIFQVFSREELGAVLYLWWVTAITGGILDAISMNVTIFTKKEINKKSFL